MANQIDIYIHNVNVTSFNDVIQHFMTKMSAWDIHCNSKWFYLCNLGNCYMLSVFL